jgi:hypothetical protein
VLTALFIGRVVAQPLALVADAPFLPRFDTWHSGALPYGLLLASQLVIVALLVRAARSVSSAAAEPHRRTGAALLAAGAVYGGAMLARLLIGATVQRGHPWFDRPLPTVFHLALAGFLLVYGHYHLRHAARA